MARIEQMHDLIASLSMTARDESQDEPDIVVEVDADVRAVAGVRWDDELVAVVIETEMV